MQKKIIAQTTNNRIVRLYRIIQDDHALAITMEAHEPELNRLVQSHDPSNLIKKACELFVKEFGFINAEFLKITDMSPTHFVLQKTESCLENSNSTTGTFRMEINKQFNRLLTKKSILIVDSDKEPNWQNIFTQQKCGIYFLVSYENGSPIGLLRLESKYDPDVSYQDRAAMLSRKLLFVRYLADYIRDVHNQADLIGSNRFKTLSEMFQNLDNKTQTIIDICTISPQENRFNQLKNFLLATDFAKLKLYVLDKENGEVTADTEYSRIGSPVINTSSTFWNQSLGRLTRIGELVWECLTKNNGVIALDPSSDIRCNVKRTFEPSNPYIIFPCGNRSMIKIDYDPKIHHQQLNHLEYETTFMAQLLTETCKTVEVPLNATIDHTGKNRANDIYREFLKNIGKEPCTEKLSIDDITERLFSRLRSQDSKILSNAIKAIKDFSTFTNINKGLIRLLQNQEIMIYKELQPDFFEAIFRMLEAQDYVQEDIKEKILEVIINLNLLSLSYETKKNILQVMSKLFLKKEESVAKLIEHYAVIFDGEKNEELIYDLLKSLRYYLMMHAFLEPEVFNKAAKIYDTAYQNYVLMGSNRVLTEVISGWGVIGVLATASVEQVNYYADQLIKLYCNNDFQEQLHLRNMIIKNLGRLQLSQRLNQNNNRDVNEIFISEINNLNLLVRATTIDALAYIAQDMNIKPSATLEYVNLIARQIYDPSRFVRDRAVIALYMVHLLYQKDEEYPNGILDLIEHSKTRSLLETYFKDLASPKYTDREESYVNNRSSSLVAEKDADIYGGKGRGLIELQKNIDQLSDWAHQQFPNIEFYTPEAFLFSGNLYSQYIMETNLEQKISDIISKINFEQRSADLLLDLNAAYAKIENAFLQTEIPPSIARVLAKRFRDLTGSSPMQESVSLRSSSEGEDQQLGGQSSIQSAAAGRYLSILNIRSIKRLLYGQRKVWASLWSPSAVLHRHKFAQDQKNIKNITMPDFIQKTIINPKNSGVIIIRKEPDNFFTVEITAGYGYFCGTNDTVTTDSYVVKICNQKITQITIYPETQIEMYVLDEEEGVKTIRVGGEAASKQKIDNSTISSIALYAAKMFELLTNNRQGINAKDMEFCIDPEGNVALIQQRDYHPDFIRQVEPDWPDLQHHAVVEKLPFVLGIADGKTIFISGRDQRLRDHQLASSNGLVIIADHLDDNTLHSTMMDARPAAIILSVGSKNSHAVLEAKELIRRFGHGIPVVLIPNAIEIFSGIKEIGIFADRDRVVFSFSTEKDKSLFEERYNILGSPKPLIFNGISTQINYTPPILRSLLDFDSLPGVFDFSVQTDNFRKLGNYHSPLPYETKVYRADHPFSQGDKNVILNSLWMINQMRIEEFERWFNFKTRHIDYDLLEDIWETLYAYILSGDKNKLRFCSKIDLLDDSILEYAHIIAGISKQFLKLAGNTYNPGILNFYRLGSRGFVTNNHIFCYFPGINKLLTGTNNDQLLHHHNLISNFLIPGTASNINKYLRGNLEADVIKGDGSIEVGIFNQNGYQTPNEKLAAFKAFAKFLLDTGVNPSLSIEIRPEYAEELPQSWKLIDLANCQTD